MSEREKKTLDGFFLTPYSKLVEEQREYVISPIPTLSHRKSLKVESKYLLFAFQDCELYLKSWKRLN